jgi:magnesium-protoporphyrin IX monomethyl ester (oxidative) cyclase
VKKIVLINPPWYFESASAARLSQNLGLGYLCAYLRGRGHEAVILDALAEGRGSATEVNSDGGSYVRVGLAYRDIVDRIPADADYIGLTAPFTNHALIIEELSAAIKERFRDVPVILGGVYPSLLGEAALTENIDMLVAGEGEKPLLAILEGKPPAEIAGVLCRARPRGAEVRPDIPEDLDALPFPDRDRLPFELYLAQRSGRGRTSLRTASVITSRGCPYACGFCSIHRVTGRSWRKRSAANVLAELRQLRGRYGVEHVDFEDDNLTLDKNRAAEIFDGIKEFNSRGASLSWSAPNGVRLETLDEPLLRKMKASGVSSIVLGVESGDPGVLKLMNKNIDLDRAYEVAKACAGLKLRARAFFMIGYPGEDEESFGRTLAFARRLKKLGVEPLFNVTRAYPGTELFGLCLEKGYIQKRASGRYVYLGNSLTAENAIVTPGCSLADIADRQRRAEKMAVPFCLRFYGRHSGAIRKFVPEIFIQAAKGLLGMEK